MALSKAGMLGTSECSTRLPFDLAWSMAGDNDYVVWSTVAGACAAFDTSLGSSDEVEMYGRYRALVLRLIEKAVEKIGWDPLESDGHTVRRSEIMLTLLHVPHTTLPVPRATRV